MKERRKVLEITQEDLYLATKKLDPDGIGISQQMISKLERGDSNKTTNLVLLATALKCSPVWLESGKGTPDEHQSNEPPAQYKITQDMIMQQALEVADGVESRLGIKINSDEKWYFIQNVAALLREKYTHNNIPINTAEIIDIAELIQRANMGLLKKGNNNEPGT